MHKADATAFAVEDKIAFFTQGSRSGNPGLEAIAPLGQRAADFYRAVLDKYGDTAFDLGKREGNLDAATLELLRL